MSTSSRSMLSEVRLPLPSKRACSEWTPQAFVAMLPPRVHQAWVAGSGPNRSPCGAAASRSRSLTAPGWTRASRRSGSMPSTASRCFVKSITTARLTAAPARPVPQPRGSSGAPWAWHTRCVATTSSIEAGMTTPMGGWRKFEASLA